MASKLVKNAKSHTKEVLDYLGKKMHLDIYYFLKGGFWLSSAHLLDGLIALIVVIAFTHLTSKELYGQYKFFIALISILTVFSLPGMNTAIVQSVSRGKDAVLAQATKVRFRWSLLGSIALALIALYMKYIQPMDIWFLFLIAAVIFPFLYSFDGYKAFFYGKRQFERAAKYTIALQFIVAVAVLAAIFFVRSILWIVVAYLVATTLTHIVLYRSALKQMSKKTDPQATHYGFHLSAMKAFEVISSQVDKLLVPYFLGFENLAIYAVASVLPDGIKGGAKLSSSLFLPKLAAMKSSKIYKGLRGKLLLSVLLSVCIAVVGVLLSPIFVPLFFSSSYDVAVPFAQVLFVSIALGIPSWLCLSLLQARKKVRAMYAYRVAVGIVSIIVLVILIPKFGVMGACFARLIARYFGAVQLWFAARSC